MASSDQLFSSEVWQAALEKYASAAHLTVNLFDAQERALVGPIHPTPLFQLFKETGYDPGISAECVRRCLAQNHSSRPAIIVSQFHGLTVVGTSLVLEDKTVGVAVGGYAFVDFFQVAEIQRLARQANLPFDRVWQVARRQKPVPQNRLIVLGELLQVLGDAVLREHYRARQYAEAAAIVASSDDAIISLDLNGAIITWNPAAERIFGYTTREAVGQPASMLVPAGHGHEEHMIHERIRRGEAVEHYETVRQGKDGRLLQMSLTVSPIIDERGAIVGASEIVRDITERKRAESEAREQERRLRRAEKIAAAGQLAASMAHEINNPLSSITNALFLLKEDSNLNESSRNLVTTAARELARVSRIVKQSLSYYRVGTTPQEMDLSSILKESLQIFDHKFRQAGIDLKSKLDEGMSLVGFPDEVRQVIDNLLLNALEAMPQGGRLSIAMHASFDWRRRTIKGVRLTIGDSGCGIPKQHRSRIFEPFFTTKSHKGTGLGLWVIQGIVSKHGGSMSLRSSDAKERSGTVVSVFLPSYQPDESKAVWPESAA
ncbi:MAG: nitrogen regulation protein NR(II) [Terriglobales bacterium]